MAGASRQEGKLRNEIAAASSPPPEAPLPRSFMKAKEKGRDERKMVLFLKINKIF